MGKIQQSKQKRLVGKGAIGDSPQPIAASLDKTEIFCKSDYERIADYANDVVNFTRNLRKQKIQFQKIGNAYDTNEVVFIYEDKGVN